jgi:uncharacterized protein YtpQ (UPF0354 family)
MENNLKKIAILIIVTLAMIAIPVEAQTLDEIKFTQAFVETVKKLESRAHPEIRGRLEVHLALDGGDEMTAYLDNAFLQYKASPQDLDSILERYVKNAIGMASGRNEDGAPILPVIRPISLLSATSPELVNGGQNPLPMIPLTSELGVFFARDQTNSLNYVTKADLEQLHQTVEELFQSSLNRLDDGKLNTQVVSAQVLAVVTGDDYAASLILSEKFWLKFPLKFKGDTVVFIPDRQTVLVTGADEPDGLKSASELAAEWYSKSAYAISSRPLVRRNGKWQAFN